MLIETHSHLSKKEFAFDLEQVIQRAEKKGVTQIISCGFDVASSLKNIEIAEKFGGVYAALGVHPHDAEKISPAEIEKIKAGLVHPKVKAIGEIGLDYYRNLSSREAQKKLFRELLKIAAAGKKPVIIHSRDAGDEVLEILNEFKQIKKIVFHCFPAEPKLAEKVLLRGYLISFTGTITFKNVKPEMLKIVEATPLEKIMLETDCPYLAPQQVRGQRNEPAYLEFIAAQVAEIKKISFEEVAAATTKNAQEFFDI